MKTHSMQMMLSVAALLLAAGLRAQSEPAAEPAATAEAPTAESAPASEPGADSTWTGGESQPASEPVR